MFVLVRRLERFVLVRRLERFRKLERFVLVRLERLQTFVLVPSPSSVFVLVRFDRFVLVPSPSSVLVRQHEFLLPRAQLGSERILRNCFY